MGDGFFKRGKLWWFRTDPIDKVARSSGKRDKRSAELEYQRRARLATDPEYCSAKERDLNSWALMLIEQKAQHKSPATASYYTKKLGHIVRFFGASSPLARLTPERFRAYVPQRRAEGAQDTTIGKEIAAAQVLCRFAAADGVPVTRVDHFKPKDFSGKYEPRTRFLLPDELERLMDALTPNRAAHVALSVAVGPRYSEAFKVLRSDVDAERWTVLVRGTKTEKARDRIPVAEPFRGLLVAALPWLPLAPWSNMRRDLARACTRAGIPPVSSNDLRRTHGSWLAEAGVPDGLISRVLRHGDERMARRVYGQARPEKLGEAIAAQLAVTKTRQSAENEVGSDGPNGKKVRVAQSVEQWIENPLLRIPDWAEAIASQPDLAAGDDPPSPLEAAQYRRVRDKNVTVFRPAVRGLRIAADLLRATNLAFDQQRLGQLRKTSARQIERLLERVATEVGRG